HLGDIYYEAGDFGKAKTEYEAALKQNPSVIRAYLNLGRSYRSLGRLETAEEIFNTLLKLDPNNAVAWKDLGELAEGRENNEAAVHAYKQYLVHSPAAPDAAKIRARIGRLQNPYKPEAPPREL
ncbi:tetratricopeptide repeat protein, partial [Bdellovibrionota bacterium]